MKREVNRTEMIALFERVRTAFPRLTMDLELEPDAHLRALPKGIPRIDLDMDVPRQPGLAFDVNLNLQGDELHLSAGSFWVEWFPCTDANVVARYFEAVTGLLSGRFRIVEHSLGSRVVKAELQRPEGREWKGVAGCTNLWALIPGRRTIRFLQNTKMELQSLSEERTLDDK